MKTEAQIILEQVGELTEAKRAKVKVEASIKVGFYGDDQAAFKKSAAATDSAEKTARDLARMILASATKNRRAATTRGLDVVRTAFKEFSPSVSQNPKPSESVAVFTVTFEGPAGRDGKVETIRRWLRKQKLG